MRILVLFVLLVFSASLFATQQTSTNTEPPSIRAVRLNADERITLDGRTDEPAWQRAEPAAGFKQSDPQNGEPATEQTEIRIVIDGDNLYIGAQFFDSNPSGVLANQMVRDGALAADDRFMWTLDPFYDQRSGYYFEINPAGAMGDAQLVPAQGGGSNFGTTQNRAWDGIWLARVRRDDNGWTAEIQIPFRTLSFDPRADAWGANFQRTVRRKNEESFWTGWGRNQGLLNLAASGRIEGITDVTQGHGLDIKPYLLGSYLSEPGRGLDATYKGNGGVDFFYNLTPQLKANLTINTDFAQTEVDDRQVNLSRFQLFFPEKRDFFLDGAGNFDFSRDPSSNMAAFFSRRIGLDANGRPQKIEYGAKMGGQAGRFNLGLLQVRTREDGGNPSEDFTVFRPKLRFFRQSYAGAIYTRRATRNSDVHDRHTVGADFQLLTTRFRGNQNLQVAGYYMRTPDGVRKDENAIWGLRVDYPNDLWNAHLFYREIQKNADPGIGFVESTDYRKLTPTLRFGPRPKNNRWVRQVAIDTRIELFMDTQGRWVERSYDVTLLDLNFHSGDTFSLGINPTYERLQRDFRVARGITLREGTEHSYTRYYFNVATANRRKISGSANFTGGTFYSGERRDLSATLNLRPRRGLLATFAAVFNRVELPEGNFSSKILRTIINTQFSPFVSVSNNVQYDSVSRVLGWQARFRWIVRPGNDVYLVWLNNWLDTGENLSTLDRSAAMKLVYTYRF